MFSVTQATRTFWRPLRNRGANKFEGTVISTRSRKTVIVEINTYNWISKYNKWLRKNRKIHAHDEAEECVDGDYVEIAHSRPYSTKKRFRVTKTLIKNPEWVAEYVPHAPLVRKLRNYELKRSKDRKLEYQALIRRQAEGDYDDILPRHREKYGGWRDADFARKNLEPQIATAEPLPLDGARVDQLDQNHDGQFQQVSVQDTPQPVITNNSTTQ